MNFIGFDLETTGFVPGVDKITEVGAVKFIDGKPESTFSTLVNPQRSIPKGASDVTGITDEMVADQPTVDKILDPFAEFCEDLPLVAHNAPFDTQFLVSDIKKFESASPQGVILDTLPIARKVFPGLANYKLGTLITHLNLPSSVFHRAEEDASYCGYVFLEILKKIFRPGEEMKLENLVALTGKPESRFPQVRKSEQQLNLL